MSQTQTGISPGTGMMAQHPTRFPSEVILTILLLNLLVLPFGKIKSDVKPQWETA